MVYDDDHIAHLVACIHIAVGLDDLRQRIDPIDHRFELARLEQLLEREQFIDLAAARLSVSISVDVE